ncbi:MAG: UDP-N-acetylmuramate dehydrogenase [Alphaproteobacteria bacterium]
MQPLLDRLPPLRGRVEAGALLAPMTWFRVGGPVEVLVRPADDADLATLLRELPADVPVTVIGAASNLLVRDGGVDGVVVRLGREFAGVERIDDATIRVGGGANDVAVARQAADWGIAGLEFLVGIPGTIGAGVRMNAGAYGREIRDVLVEATAIDRRGVVHRVAAADLNLSYRHCDAPADWIFTSTTLRGTASDAATVQAAMADISKARAESQPVKARTGGSTFKNPAGHSAWALVDAAGCRGLRLGGAQVSDQHTNFLINTGEATAADLEALGERVREKVKQNSGIELEWEIQRIGRQVTS